MTALTLTGGRPLTATEIQMLAVLAEGHTHERIAHEVGVTRYTVSTVLSDVYRRIGARNATHAVAIAIRTGLIPTA